MKNPARWGSRGGAIRSRRSGERGALLKSYHRIRREQIRINFRRDKIL